MTIQNAVTRTLVPEDRRLAVTAEVFGGMVPDCASSPSFTPSRRLMQGLQRRLLGVLHTVQWRILHGTVRRSAFPRDLPEPFHGRSVGRRFGDHGMSVRLQQSKLFRSGRFRGVCFDQYHWLREYMVEHPEVGEILGATD